MDRTFPVEILGMVFKYLPTSDWEQLRLVCRTFEEILRPELFSNVKIWIEKDSLQRLISISTSDRLSSLVKSISIGNAFVDNEILTPESFLDSFLQLLVYPGQNCLKFSLHSHVGYFLEDGAWEGGIIEFWDRADWSPWSNAKWRENTLHTLEKLGWNIPKLHAAYESYKKLILEQHEFLETDVSVTYLTQALDNLPKLREVKFVRNTLGDPLGSKFNIGVICVSPGPTQPRWYGDCKFLTFLKALKASKVETLTSITFQDQGMLYSEIDLALIGEILPKLRCITSLKLPLGRQRTEQRNVHACIQKMENVLCALVQGLPLLQHLSLESPTFSDPYHHYYYFPVQKILDSLSTNSLKTLSIHSGIFKGPNCLKFFRKHSDTLKTIGLREVMVEGSNAKSLFASMRTATNLDEVQFEGNVLSASNGFCGWASPARTAYDYNCRRLGAEPVCWIESDDDKVRRDSARALLSAFVMRKTDCFPLELLDFDDSTGEERQSDWPNCVGVLGNPRRRTEEDQLREATFQNLSPSLLNASYYDLYHDLEPNGENDSDNVGDADNVAGSDNVADFNSDSD